MSQLRAPVLYWSAHCAKIKEKGGPCASNPTQSEMQHNRDAPHRSAMLKVEGQSRDPCLDGMYLMHAISLIVTAFSMELVTNNFRKEFIGCP